jgi:CDP-L-myo-inositol myo-inositolphosphotransferase
MSDPRGGGTDFDFEGSLKPPLHAKLPRIVHVDRLVNRPLAALIVRASLRLNLRPNQLTVASFIVSAAGALFFLGGGRRSFVAAGLLIYAGTLLDGADGMLARSRNLCTRFGAYLDLYLDRLVDFLVLGGMITGYYRQSGRLGFYLLSVFGLGAYMLQMVLYYLEREYRGLRSGSGASGDYRGIVYLGILAFSLLNRLDIVISILLVIPVLNIPYRFVRYWIIERPEERPPQARRQPGH